jgi:hypothetical protein
MTTFSETVNEAIREFSEKGFQSEIDLQEWMQKLRQAAEADMTPRWRMEEMLAQAMRAIYDRLVERAGMLTSHPGASRFTLSQVKPKLRDDLNRRILASAQLIRLNRNEVIEKTLRRFAGWATSIPKGGSSEGRREPVEDIKKALRGLPFVERRVLVDQGAKLNSSISATLAMDGGAIAAKWHSHWRQANYDYREDHKERDGKVYLVRGSWAHKAGLVKRGDVGYSDEVTQPAEEVYCRCRWIYLYHLRQLPDSMITDRGRVALRAAKEVRSA